MKYILLIIFLPIALISQDDESLIPMKIGVTMGGNYIQNDTDVPVIPGDTCCGNYSEGTASGFHMGLAFNYEILPSFLSLDLKTFFDSRPAELQAQTSKYELYNESTDSYQQATFQHDYDAKLNYFAMDLGLKVQPIKTIPISFRAGYEISDPSITKEYSNERRLVEPGGYQSNGESVNTIEKGELNNLNTAQGVSGSLIADIDLGNGLIFSPEITYRHPLNSSMEDVDWFTTVIRGGATISWDLAAPDKRVEPEPEPEPIEEVQEEDPEEIVQKEPEPEIEKDVIKSISADDLNITETVVTQTYPILPYIFFDSSAVELREKYKHLGSTKNFKEDELPKNSVKIYHRILDILGNRMKSSNSNITVKGYSDGFEEETLAERKALAYKRASSVKNYLVSKWDIEGYRINIESDDKPDKPTSYEYKEGYEENRRVEIIPDDINLLSPVVHSEFIEYAANKENLNLDIELNNDNIKDYSIFIKSNSGQIYSKTNLNKPEASTQINLDQKLIANIAKHSEDNPEVELMVTKADGSIETKTENLKVEKEVNDYELGRLNLIVFDFDKSEISETNKKMINNFIVENISDNSEVDIIGSTDFLGERKYNKELSQKRADNTAEYISSLLPDVEFNKVEGRGSDNPKFDNKTPEGRFYCRTVMIEVKTPLSIK